MSDTEPVIQTIEGEKCRLPYCAGRVRKQEYRERSIWVCDECGTAAVQSW